MPAAPLQVHQKVIHDLLLLVDEERQGLSINWQLVAQLLQMLDSLGLYDRDFQVMV